MFSYGNMEPFSVTYKVIVNITFTEKGHIYIKDKSYQPQIWPNKTQFRVKSFKKSHIILSWGKPHCQIEKGDKEGHYKCYIHIKNYISL